MIEILAFQIVNQLISPIQEKTTIAIVLVTQTHPEIIITMIMIKYVKRDVLVILKKQMGTYVKVHVIPKHQHKINIKMKKITVLVAVVLLIQVIFIL